MQEWHLNWHDHGTIFDLKARVFGSTIPLSQVDCTLIYPRTLSQWHWLPFCVNKPTSCKEEFVRHHTWHPNCNFSVKNEWQPERKIVCPVWKDVRDCRCSCDQSPMRMEGGLFFIDVEEGSGRQPAWTGADVFYECKHSSRLLGTRTPP